MSFNSAQCRHVRARRASQRGWVLLLLLASLWRGPLPWCHTHAAPESASQTSAELAWHVQWLHHAAALEEVVAGWHWHFVLPTDVDGDGRQDGESNAAMLGPNGVSGDGRLLNDQLSGSSDWNWMPLMASSDYVEPSLAASPICGYRPELGRAFRCGPDVRLLASVVLC